MEKRGKTEFRSTWKAQSRIASYIKGTLPLDQMIHKDRIIKPEERHNKRAFLPHINDDLKIVPRKFKEPKTVEIKIDSRRPTQHRVKSKIKEMDPETGKFVTPKNTGKRNVISFELNSKKCYFLINKEKDLNNALGYRNEKSDDESSFMESQQETPIESPCNGIIPVISNVNDTAPDTIYYEETLNTKNDEIAMLKDKIRSLQKNIIAKNVSADGDCGMQKLLASLSEISKIIKELKSASNDDQIMIYIKKIEQEQDHWYSHVANISDGIKHLKDSNVTMKTENVEKSSILEEKTAENEKLMKKLSTLKNETNALKSEKVDYMDMLSASKHTLKIAQKENQDLRKEIQDHKRLNEKATEEIDMLTQACEKVQIDLKAKEKHSIELQDSLHKQIAEYETANAELVKKYESISVEIGKINQEKEKAELTANELENNYRHELDTLSAAKQQYIEKLEKEAARLKQQIEDLHEETQQLSQENENSYSLIAQLNSENQSLRDDTKYMHREKLQLRDAIEEWSRDESSQDSLKLIEMIENLKMKMLTAETNYSNRLFEHLDETVKFTRLLSEQSDS